MKRFLAELWGTFFLTLAIVFTHDNLAIGLMLMAMAYFFGPVSGGHFNPAVSLGVLLRGKLAVDHFIKYVIAQISGAALAALSFGFLAKQATAAKVGAGLQLYVPAGFEILFTFVFVGVILVLTTTDKSAGQGLNGLLIGLTLAAVATLPVGFYNPAVAFGTEIADLVHGVSGATIQALVVHGVLPFVGAALASFKVRMLYS